MRRYLLLVMLVVIVLSLPVSAQSSSVLVDGLTNPRGLAYDQVGNLWISEAGSGGDLTGQTDLGPVQYGSTARVLELVPGKAVQVVMAGLPSAQGFDDIIGVSSVYANEDGLWLVTGLGPLADPLNMALIGLDSTTMRVKQFVDLYSFEATNNPDQDIVTSDPIDVAQGNDGTYYIADASGNDLLTWTPTDGLKLFHVWLDLPVPTSVDVDLDGNLYVGFLSPFPYDKGSARVEKWSPEGQLLQTYSGLTAVTDVMVDQTDGSLYAVQFSAAYGDLGWIPGSGSVVKVGSDGSLTPLAENLNYPYRLAQAPDGGIVVTVNSAFSDAGSGQVIALSGEAAMSAQPPASTPDSGG